MCYFLCYVIRHVLCKKLFNHKKNLHKSLGECAICLEEMLIDHLEAYQCGHVFHTSCLREWLMIKDICPICGFSQNE